MEALVSDVIVVKSLPSHLMEGRKQKQYPVFKPKSSSSPKFYLQEVLPKLKSAKVIGLILNDGGGLQVHHMCNCLFFITFFDLLYRNYGHLIVLF